MTFSIAARCRETGQLGIAISSSSIAVGARCPWLVPGVGAVSSQNITLPALGPMVLSKLGRRRCATAGAKAGRQRTSARRLSAGYRHRQQR
ncbi:Family of uncharacterised function (DUF1028) [Cedecea neteri]|uniref:Family of uncharacterized function (DUF1028) n=1 Tax=Cedecea neteri TaxID=158822 RepID=A0A2X3KT03_9ENTR|nr:Family of uncharacterised function (DUF1028) [Cedecea neteri]